ncbi:MAG: substrate-binding domain-containing protein [Bdellovibrionia bacterium]
MLISFLVLNANPCFAQSAKWTGPTDGPRAQAGKQVIFIGSDLKNGGIAAVYRGFEAAANAVNWRVSAVDGEGNIDTLKKQMMITIKSHPDGIVIAGLPQEYMGDLLTLIRQSEIALVGWHSAAKAGSDQKLFVNVSTDPIEVAKIAAEYIIRNEKGKIGVVIFNDSSFAVANAKTKWMREALAKCKRCKVLAVEDHSISAVEKDIPKVIIRLNKKFGHTWTHNLAINDAYFDSMNFSLSNIGRSDIKNISAGDGSNKALSRIKSGASQQVATVAEPLNIQGWQLVDELNRLFSGTKPSGYVTRPLLITSQVLERAGESEKDIDSALGDYKNAYLSIWKK